MGLVVARRVLSSGTSALDSSMVWVQTQGAGSGLDSLDEEATWRVEVNRTLTVQSPVVPSRPGPEGFGLLGTSLDPTGPRWLQGLVVETRVWSEGFAPR